MLDFRRITLFCLEKRLSKHKMTIFSKNLRGLGPSGPPLATTMTRSKPKTFRKIGNEQHTSHTDPCTGYVRILYHYQLNVTYPSIVMSTVKFINEIV